MVSMLLLAATGCIYEEDLPQVDVHGQVVVPRAAATRDVVDERTGEVNTITDTRWIGPVFLGAFPAVNTLDYGYPHPETGPVIGSNPGNTYPYGGGSVGRFDFACFESMVCRMATGRFKDFEDIIDWYNDTIDKPVVDEFGATVDSPDYFRSYCYELLNYTDDYELSFIACPDGLNADGTCSGLDFEENSDGDFVAEFDLWQVTYQQDMKIWGWMDSPGSDYNFTTCNPEDGRQNNEYANDYDYGTNFRDLINYPNKYIGTGDWLVEDPYATAAEDAAAFRDSGEQVSVTLGYELED